MFQMTVICLTLMMSALRSFMIPTNAMHVSHIMPLNRERLENMESYLNCDAFLQFERLVLTDSIIIRFDKGLGRPKIRYSVYSFFYYSVFLIIIFFFVFPLCFYLRYLYSFKFKYILEATWNISCHVFRAASQWTSTPRTKET